MSDRELDRCAHAYWAAGSARFEGLRRWGWLFGDEGSPAQASARSSSPPGAIADVNGRRKTPEPTRPYPPLMQGEAHRARRAITPLPLCIAASRMTSRATRFGRPCQSPASPARRPASAARRAAATARGSADRCLTTAASSPRRKSRSAACQATSVAQLAQIVKHRHPRTEPAASPAARRSRPASRPQTSQQRQQRAIAAAARSCRVTRPREDGCLSRWSPAGYALHPSSYDGMMAIRRHVKAPGE